MKESDEFSSLYEKIYMMHDLSYKYFRSAIKKLSEEDKRELYKLKQIVHPEHLLFMLKLYKLGFPFKMLTSLLDKRYDDYIRYLPKRKNKMQKPITSEKKLAKEFTFRGFERLSETSFKKKDKYDHLLSNRLIDGDTWIYPYRFSIVYKLLKPGVYKNIDNHASLIGVHGYTRSEYRKKPIKNNKPQ